MEIYIIIIFFLIIYIIFYYINIKLRKYYSKIDYFIDNKPNYWFTTFGGGGSNYYDAVNRLTKEINILNIFNNTNVYTDNDLKNDNIFWDKHQHFINNNPRGYGYWLWKPYIILNELKKMKNNDILLYLDAGCEIQNNKDSVENMLKLLDKCNNNNMLYVPVDNNIWNKKYFEKNWTKSDLFEYMSKNGLSDIDSSKKTIQYQAGVIFIKKNDLTYKLIEEWYNIGSSNYNLINDSDSITTNDLSFIEHRHDQSIFSLLIKKYNLNKDNNILINYLPILYSRKRNG